MINKNRAKKNSLPGYGSRPKGIAAEVFLVVITVVSSVIIVTTINPIIEQGKQTQAFNDAKQVLKTVDATINQLMYEAPGSRRAIDLNLPSGRFIFSGSEDKIKIRLQSGGIMESGVRIEDEGIIIQGGSAINAYDNGTDYILENAAVLFAVKKIGSPNNYSFVNTTDIISLIRNKRADSELAPKSGIFINDTADSSYGLGFTELAQTSNVQTGAIRLHVNSTRAEYDTVFTLSASMDFVEIEVKNVVPK
jgi:hypothetical protein